jgi:hypothetical protein
MSGRQRRTSNKMRSSRASTTPASFFCSKNQIGRSPGPEQPHCVYRYATTTNAGSVGWNGPNMAALFANMAAPFANMAAPFANMDHVPLHHNQTVVLAHLLPSHVELDAAMTKPMARATDELCAVRCTGLHREETQPPSMSLPSPMCNLHTIGTNNTTLPTRSSLTLPLPLPHDTAPPTTVQMTWQPNAGSSNTPNVAGMRSKPMPAAMSPVPHTQCNIRDLFLVPPLIKFFETTELQSPIDLQPTLQPMEGPPVKSPSVTPTSTTAESPTIRTTAPKTAALNAVELLPPTTIVESPLAVDFNVTANDQVTVAKNKN